MARTAITNDEPRTTIEDISPLGPELNDAELELVAGGKPRHDPNHSSKTYWADGCSDGVDVDF